MDGEEKRPAARVWELAEGVMYRTAYDVLGSRADAEDAVMDAMVRIIRNEEKFRDLDESDLRALAVIYVRNTAIDRYNANRRIPYPVECLPERVDDAPTPEEATVDGESTARLLRLIEAMPPSYRDVLLLKIRYGMDIGEIAAILRLKNGTVRTRLSRARDWLEKQLADGNTKGEERETR